MWDPEVYLGYLDLRARPFYDLIERIDEPSPRRVVDLGCGPGNLTAVLQRRWPRAVLEAVDSSPEMVLEAKSRGIDAAVGDVRGWQPRPDTDVVIANSVLHWVPEHRELLLDWVRKLGHGAWIGMQVPGNMAAASHVVSRALAASPVWAARLGSAMLDADAVAGPVEYAELLAETGCEVDAWETTYAQRLAGKDPVLEWLSGTALRPVKAALEDDLWEQFRKELAPRLRRVYPARADGTTWFPFRRVFVVARVR